MYTTFEMVQGDPLQMFKHENIEVISEGHHHAPFQSRTLDCWLSASKFCAIWKYKITLEVDRHDPFQSYI